MQHLRTALRMIACVAVLGILPASVRAQGSPPAVAARAPLFDAAVGYEYFNMALAGNRVSMNGADANLTGDITPKLGFRLDLGYARAKNVLGTGRHADVLSYLGGPVFTPFRRKRWSVYGEALVGAARVTAPVPTGNGNVLVGGYANKLSWAFGGGVEYKFYKFSALGVRAGVDYLRTAYFTPSLAINGQTNIRVTVSAVYSFGHKR